MRVKHKQVFLQSFFCVRKQPTKLTNLKSLAMIRRINKGTQILIPYSCEGTNFHTQPGDRKQWLCGGEDAAEPA